MATAWRRGAVVRLAGAWVLAGACAKAFTGTPAELPAPILASELDPFLVIVVAVVVETAVALLAIAKPRAGWLPLAALLGVFVAILALHLGSGAERCGCFGGALAVPAWLVLAVDLALLAAVLVVRPWRLGPASPRGAAPQPGGGLAVAGVAALGCAVALGWFADRRLDSLRPVEGRAPASSSTSSPASSPASSLASPLASTASAVTGSAPAASGRSESHAPPPPAATAAPPAPWRLPEAIPDQVILRPLQWVGKRLADTELGRWADTSTWPKDATVILYYKSCNHCAAHLRALAEQQSSSPASAPKYVLAQLPTPAAYTGRLFVDRVPEGTLVELPAAVKTWVITPPWNVFLKDGVVRGAERVKWSGEK